MTIAFDIVKKIGIVGATGYTGVELLRLLAVHPGVEITYVTSRSNAGTRVDSMFPNLRGFIDLEFSDPTTDALAQCDLVFFATPNGVAMKHTAELVKSGVKVIDLAADFRIKDLDVWSKWYGMTHACPDLVEQAVYGLPEINRESVKTANLVANPGCYPTSVILGLMPLLENKLIDLDNIIADTKVWYLQKLYEERYKNEFFVDVLPQGSHPETRSVKASNMCQIAVHRIPDSSRVVVLSVIDNLVKGAAGQAVQNMNLMLGLEENTAINKPALLP
ncbi:N-acetyl-gamma-glutamyl-phosphate reductase [Nymphon striatum]|nr:N-acetyl-gamma-glutamyl-phosphate reductase [Nymphon striatum]